MDTYSLLDNTWNSYDKFNNSVTNDETTYNTVCEAAITGENSYKLENSILCIKLLKNLLSLFKELNARE
ncbi:PIR Superfamily Protein [Plasmodium ovale wallikeri]|uniref:PIR Superfamily Protein n=1 Tax=Plasmodium ovale wallikeri TaxID=864142 RepID=A0A1A9ATE5_PLAOA|nr:PIR Superfamily Protein [Plasmodium ovale wallikeri]